MKKQDAGRKILGDIAPKFAELNDDVLFGEVWAREQELSLRDRSLITISANDLDLAKLLYAFGGALLWCMIFIMMSLSASISFIPM